MYRGCRAPVFDAHAPDLPAVGGGYPTHRRRTSEPYPHRMRTVFDPKEEQSQLGSDSPTYDTARPADTAPRYLL